MLASFSCHLHFENFLACSTLLLVRYCLIHIFLTMRYVDKCVNDVLCLFERISLIQADLYTFLHTFSRFPPAMCEIIDIHYDEKKVVKETNLERCLMIVESLGCYHRSHFRCMFRKMINKQYTKFTITAFKTAAYLSFNAEYEIEKIVAFRSVVDQFQDPTIISWHLFLSRIPKIVKFIKNECKSIAKEFHIEVPEPSKNNESLKLWKERVDVIDQILWKGDDDDYDIADDERINTNAVQQQQPFSV